MSLVSDAGAVRQAPDGVRRLRMAALALTAALVVLGAGWELAWAPTGRGTLALKVLPLLLPLPGLWRHRLYTYRWLSLLVWLYVAEGAVRATSDPGVSARLAAVELALGVLLFAVCALYVRMRLRGAAADPGSPMETRR